jgi:hypothetical protein
MEPTRTETSATAIACCLRKRNLMSVTRTGEQAGREGNGSAKTEL